MAATRTVALATTAAVLAAALAGCNLVYTNQPMFAPSEAAPARGLKPGLWVAPEPACEFDVKAPLSDWPECAHPRIIEADRGYDPGRRDEAGLFAFIDGDPPFIQTEAEVNMTAGGDAAQGPAAGDAAEKKKPPIYLYIGVTPLERAADGRIVRASLWLAQCGPPPPPASGDAEPSPDMLVTKSMLPGLKPDGGGCQPVSREALRNAIKASRAWRWMGQTLPEIRYVRPA